MNEKEQLLTTEQPENKDYDFLLDKHNKEVEEYQSQIKMLQNELDQRFSEIATLTQLLLEKDKSKAGFGKRQIKSILGIRYIKGPLRFFAKLLRIK